MRYDFGSDNTAGIAPAPVALGKELEQAGASYADVVEPVQKAVVSVYSSKIVAQRAAISGGRGLWWTVCGLRCAAPISPRRNGSRL